MTDVVIDSDGNITDLTIIDSGGTAGSGESGPRSTSLISGGVSNSDFSIDGYRKWDTKPDVQRQPPRQKTTQNSAWGRVPSFSLFGIQFTKQAIIPKK